MLPRSILVAFQGLAILRAVAGASNDQDPLVQPFPPFDQEFATICRYRQQQSVNLGSWFVNENWISPSTFAQARGPNVSEIDIASGSNARAILENHWDTFINETDFAYLRKVGINTVRLPIGYWSLGPAFCQGTPFDAYADVYTNSWSHVVRAINWAGNAGMGVLVDLHGAPGSQNGQPHSGISDGKTGLFNSETNMNRTLEILKFLAQQLCDVSNVVGIQILNEPQDCAELPGFYDKAIAAIRQIPCDLPLYIHDAFNLKKYGDYVANQANQTGFIVEDHHSYFVFTADDKKKSTSQHTEDIRTSVTKSFQTDSNNRSLIIGEWSCAQSPQSSSQETNPAAARRDFGMAQLDAYSDRNTTGGWSFWTYKTEDCDTDPGWCFTAAVGRCLPSNFSAYKSSGNSPRSMAHFIDRDLRSLARHRPKTIYHRRWTQDTDDRTPEERSNDRGYLDGFSAAELFYDHDESKLGFIVQYIKEQIQALGCAVVAPGTDSNYTTGFMEGLADGETSYS
ncbi:glycoside hydrolase superfamily [Mycena galopus ATCC 62051]|nr:glycoside hydrolase superfamily [Mycena galopus ATCC 62051]